MEKICIVNLRKKMTNPVDVREDFARKNLANEGGIPKDLSIPVVENRGIREIHDGGVRPDDNKDAAGRTVSLMLTRDQTRALQSDPYIRSFLSAKSAEGFEAIKHRDQTIVVKFEFGSMPPLRLLKVEEVIQMLRISRSYLNELVRQGKLKSYKLGRLRRLMLDDILFYLEASQELTNIRQQDLKSKTSQLGTAQHYIT
jgi:excisionase family DNA binding protein